MEYLSSYFEHQACDIYYNEDLNVVQTLWKGLFVQGDEFREILDKMIELLAIKKTHIILADARKMKVISKEDRQWIVDNWYPRAVEAGFNFEALIVSKDTFNELSIKKIVQNYEEQKVKTVYCLNYAEATGLITAEIKK